MSGDSPAVRQRVFRAYAFGLAGGALVGLLMLVSALNRGADGAALVSLAFTVVTAIAAWRFRRMERNVDLGSVPHEE